MSFDSGKRYRATLVLTEIIKTLSTSLKKLIRKSEKYHVRRITRIAQNKLIIVERRLQDPEENQHEEENVTLKSSQGNYDQKSNSHDLRGEWDLILVEK